MKDKNMMITLGITFFLFAFVSFLVYLIYCYAYFDKNQEGVFVSKFNQGSYDYVYDNFYNKDEIDKQEFYDVINLMYDKVALKNIYYLNYKNSIYKTLDEFINEYYFGDNDVLEEDVLFASRGKTGLFKRRDLYYSTIKVESGSGLRSSLGIKSNITLKIEDGASLKLDDKDIECSNDECVLDKVFGGIHTIDYVSNGFDYYGLINISTDNETIDIASSKSLIKINKVDINEEEVPISTTDYDLKIGKYSLNKCYLSDNCPAKKNTYIQLNEDNSCTFYTYISLSKAGDTYVGTYEIVGNFLVMKFREHTYSVFDYDTKVTTDIVGEVDMEMRYKIEADNIISNDSYRFKFAEQRKFYSLFF